MTVHNAAIAKRRSALALRLVAALTLATSLAGCYPHGVMDTVETYPRDYRVRHPISLHEGSHTVQVFVGRNRGGLTPSQRADVLSFAQVWRRNATSGISIEVPGRGPSVRAARDTLREIESIFAAAGIPRRAVYVHRYRPVGNELAAIRLDYSKVVADAGPCGVWPDDLGPTSDIRYVENRPYWNFGCATQRNLAAMVDNPADLVQPRGETPAYAARRSVAIDKYRKGEDPSGKYSGYDANKISEVGK
jgi:pilus assembly protein CpaD